MAGGLQGTESQSATQLTSEALLVALSVFTVTVSRITFEPQMRLQRLDMLRVALEKGSLASPLTATVVDYSHVQVLQGLGLGSVLKIS